MKPSLPALFLLALVLFSISGPLLIVNAATQDSSLNIAYQLPQYGTVITVSADIFTSGPNAFSGVAYYADRINFTFASLGSASSAKISYGIGFQNANAMITSISGNYVTASSTCPSGFCYEYYHFLPNASIPNQVLVNGKLVRQANYFTSSGSFTSSTTDPAVYLNSSFNSLTIRFSQGDPTIQVLNSVLPCNGINNLLASIVGDYSLLGAILIISAAMALMKIFTMFWGGSGSKLSLPVRSRGLDLPSLQIANTPVKIVAMVILVIVGLIIVVSTQTAVLNSVAC